MCMGTHTATDAVADQISSFTNTLVSQASQVFAQDTGVFNTLKNAYTSIVNAGPSQAGWSAAEQSAVNSQIINQAAVSNRNIASAAGNRASAIGGGNTPLAPTGAQANQNASIAEQVEAQKSGELTQAQIANYQQGNVNWQAAGKGLEAAPNVMNNSAMFDTSIQKGQGMEMTNAEAQEARSNWWVKPVEGLAGMGLNMVAPGLGTALTSGMGVSTGSGSGGNFISNGMGNTSSDSTFGENIGNFFSGMGGKTTGGSAPTTTPYGGS